MLLNGVFILKKDATATIFIGQAVDATDGFTPETGLTAGGVDEIGIYKAGATALTDISGTTTLTHRAGGVYTVTLTASNTDTLGQGLFVLRDDSVCRPIAVPVMVVPTHIYESMFVASKYQKVDVAQWLTNAVTAGVDNRPAVDAEALGGDVTAMTNLKRGANALVTGSVNDGSASTTAFVTDLTEATNDHYNGRVITFTSGNLAGQTGTISDYNGTTKQITLENALTEAPADEDEFVIS